MQKSLLNQSDRPTREHYRILFMSWAGWVFDFYDLILYTFLLIPIGQELHLSSVQLSLVLGTSLAATAIGGVIFGLLSDKYGRKSVLQWTPLECVRRLPCTATTLRLTRSTSSAISAENSAICDVIQASFRST